MSHNILGLLALAQTVSLPSDASTNEMMVLRWIHFIAGITWIGLLYFFNLVNVPFAKELDASLKPKVVPPLMSRALWWFRWSSVVTVLAGLRYFWIIIAADASNAGVSAARPLWSWLVIWTLAFAIEMAVLMAPADVLRKGPVLGLLMAMVVIAAACMYVRLNSHGWESNRLLSIGIGGGMGWFMMLNVWGIIWRIQKRLIPWTAASATTPMPAQAAKMARLAFLASRVNFALSIPMLFFMGAASHYTMFAR